MKQKEDIQSAINQYLESKSLAWTESTLKSEAARLNVVIPVLASGDATLLWEYTKGLAPYSRLTTWTRVKDFWDYSFSNEINPYKDFMRLNRRQFKNVYSRKKIKIDYSTAIEAINQIQDESIRLKAMELISAGMRFTESLSISSESEVTGKGGKTRKVYPAVLSCYKKSYSTFWRELKKVGLKPHDLRKLAATRAVENGATAADLLEIFGWENIQTASFYLQPKNDEKLKELLR